MNSHPKTKIFEQDHDKNLNSRIELKDEKLFSQEYDKKKCDILVHIKDTI